MSNKINFVCEGKGKWGVFYNHERIGCFTARKTPEQMYDWQRERIALLFESFATGEKEFFDIAEEVLHHASF
jgi:hypothetical protein